MSNEVNDVLNRLKVVGANGQAVGLGVYEGDGLYRMYFHCAVASPKDLPEANAVAAAVTKACRSYDKLVSELEAVRRVLQQAPELNMSNYTHDQVRDLNNAMIEAFMLIEPDVALADADTN